MTSKSSKEEIEAEVSRLASLPPPANGRRRSLIVHPNDTGTGLAPFHQFDSKVPADLKSEVDQLKQDIISGKITVTSPAQPK